MKFTAFAALLCAACAGTANAERVTSNSSSQHTLRFAGSGPRTLEVRAIAGAITIEAYDGQSVEMVVKKTITAQNEEALRAAERDVKLETEDNAASVSAIVDEPYLGVCGDENMWDGARGRRPKYSVRFDFTIRVPRNTQLELCTINSGDVSVTGTRGDFEIRSVNGRITMTDMDGSGEAITVNGRVTASFRAAPRKASHFKTINGDVVLTMPEPDGADLRMKTFNGGLYTDFEVQPVATPVRAAAERDGGMFVYRSNEFTTVRVGKGGPELTLDTLNGDVRVLRRPK